MYCLRESEIGNVLDNGLENYVLMNKDLKGRNALPANQRHLPSINKFSFVFDEFVFKQYDTHIYGSKESGRLMFLHSVDCYTLDG